MPAMLLIVSPMFPGLTVLWTWQYSNQCKLSATINTQIPLYQNLIKDENWTLPGIWFPARLRFEEVEEETKNRPGRSCDSSLFTRHPSEHVRNANGWQCLDWVFSHCIRGYLGQFTAVGITFPTCVVMEKLRFSLVREQLCTSLWQIPSKLSCFVIGNYNLQSSKI